jgi:hypothetical protein
MLNEGKVTAADEQAQAEAIYRDTISAINAHQPLIVVRGLLHWLTRIAKATSKTVRAEEKRGNAVRGVCDRRASRPRCSPIKSNQLGVK